jgi:putative ABC transport system permease protein
VLKTLGYRRWHLMIMFGLETALIGAIGSVIGIGAALLLGHPLMSSMERTGIFLLEWKVDPSTLISGGLAGVATALIFGFYAILRASAVRPAAILRHYDTSKSWQQWLGALGVYGVLVIPFGVVSIFIMGSFIQGVGVILLALVGFVALGLIMGSALWLATHIPMPGLLKLARNNLKRQQFSLIFALIALFIGVVAISIAVATLTAAQREMDDRIASLDGINLVVYGQAEQDAEIRAEMSALDGLKSMQTRYLAEIATLEIQIDGVWQPVEINWMEGRSYSEPDWGLDLFGATWGGSPDAAYLPYESRSLYGGLQPGMHLRMRGASGSEQALTLAGFYQLDESTGMTIMQRSLILDQNIVTTGSNFTVIYEAEMKVSKLKTAARALGKALPSSMVISASDVREVMQGILFSLFSFVITIAGFALVAGAVLIANAVGLSMIERRREIGVMKTVGYTSRHVLLTLVLEHGQLGILAGLLGTVAVKIALHVIRESQPEIALSLDILPGLAIIVVCTGFALFSVLTVAWRPTRIPPLAVLRDE